MQAEVRWPKSGKKKKNTQNILTQQEKEVRRDCSLGGGRQQEKSAGPSSGPLPRSLSGLRSLFGGFMLAVSSASFLQWADWPNQPSLWGTWYIWCPWEKNGSSRSSPRPSQCLILLKFESTEKTTSVLVEDNLEPESFMWELHNTSADLCWENNAKTCLQIIYGV